MNYIKKLFIGILFLIGTSASAQEQNDNIFTNLKKTIDRADAHYNNYSYTLALDLYKQVLAKEPSNQLVKVKVARCYRKLNNSLESDIWYKKAINQGALPAPEDHLYYVQALLNNGKYDEAKIQLVQYTQSKKDIRALNNLTGLDKINFLYKDSASVTVSKAGFNSEENDFSPIYHEGDIMFISDRKNTQPFKYINSWTQGGFNNIFQVSADPSLPRSPKAVNNSIGSQYHEGPINIYDGGKKIIFTRSIVKRNQNGERILGLFLAEKSTKKGWANVEPFSFNHPEYSLYHPAMNERGDTLYFASDMPGGYGGADIYFCTKIAGQWTIPENLGRQINTEGNELFPFLRGSFLFLSSDGHEGLGGLDIYKVDLKEPVAYKLVNMGYPINSSHDDLSISWQNENAGVFSSNRPGGLGKDDIYFFNYNEKLKENIEQNQITVNGYVFDKTTNEAINDASIYIINENTGDDLSLMVDKGGKFSFKGIKGHSYTVLADNAYKSALLMERKVTDSLDVIALGMWGFAPRMAIQAAIIDYETKFPVKLASVELLEKESILMQVQTSFDGKADLIGKAGEKYNLKISRAGYVSKELPIELPLEKLSDTLKLKVVLEKINHRPIQVKGIVLDTTQQAVLEGTRIYIINEITGEKQSISTKKDGTFEFEALAGNIYKAITEYDNRRAVVSNIKIEDPANSVNQSILLNLNNFEKQKHSGNVKVQLSLLDKNTRQGLEFGIVKLFLNDTIQLADYADLEGNLVLHVIEGLDYTIKSDVQGYKEKSSLFSTFADQAMDTLKVELLLEKHELSYLKGIVLDHESGKGKPGVKMLVLNETTGEEQETITSKNGAFSFIGKPGEVYSILAEEKHKKGSINHLTVMEHHFNKPLKVDLYDDKKNIKAEITVADKITGEGIPLAEIQIFHNNIILHSLKTDIGGFASVNLQADKDYRIKLNHKAYKTLEMAVDRKQSVKDGKIILYIPLQKDIPGQVVMKGNVTMGNSQLSAVGANVLIINNRNGIQRNVKSDVQGKFEFNAKVGETFNIIGDLDDKSGMVLNVEAKGAEETINNKIYFSVDAIQSITPMKPQGKLLASFNEGIAKNKIKHELLGRVYDEATGAPVMHANVNIINDHSGTSQSLQSDENGFFKFKGFPGEEFTILADTDRKSGLYPYMRIKNAEDTVKIAIGGLPFRVILKLQLVNNQKKPVKAASIRLLEQGKIIQQELSSISGEVLLRGYQGGKYEAEIIAVGYEEKRASFDIPLDYRHDTLSHLLKIDNFIPKTISVSGVIVNDALNVSTERADIYIMNELTWDIQKKKADKKGGFTFDATEGESYHIIAETKDKNANIQDLTFNTKNPKISITLQDNVKKEIDVASYVNVEVEIKENNVAQTVLPGILRVFQNDTIQQTLHVNKMGKRSIRLIGGKDYQIEGSMLGYEPAAQKFTARAENLQDTTKVILKLTRKKITTASVVGVAIDGTTQKALEGALVYIKNKKTGEEQEVKTNHEGSFTFKAVQGESYIILGKNKDLIGSVRNFNLPENISENTTVPPLSISLFSSLQPAIIMVHVIQKDNGKPVVLANLEMSHQELYHQKLISNQIGKALFHAPRGKDYSLKINHPSYKPASLKVPAFNNDKDSLHIYAELELNAPITTILYGHVYDGENNRPIKDADIHIINDKNDETLDLKADVRGDFSFEAQVGLTYMILADNNIRSGLIEDLLVHDPQIKTNEMIKIPAYGILNPILVSANIENAETGMPLEKAECKIFHNQVLIAEGSSNDKGNMLTEIYRKDGYFMLVKKDGYESRLISLNLVGLTSGDTSKLMVKLNGDENVLVQSIIAKLNNPQHQKVSIINFTSDKKLYLSFEEDIYEFKQSPQRAYLDNSKEVIPLSNNRQEGLSLSAYLQDLIKKNNLIAEENQSIQNLYYDFNKFNLSIAAHLELNKVIALMQKHKNLNLELRAYTDTRGSFEYNMLLARKRVNAAFQYLVANGVEENRLIKIPVGKAGFVADCNSKNCTEEEHQLDRRTEFMIKYTVKNYLGSTIQVKD